MTADTVYEYTVSATPIEGLTLTADYFDVGSVGVLLLVNNLNQVTGQLNMLAGPVSVGYGRGYVATAIGTPAASVQLKTSITTAMAVGFAVNENLSISYSKEESTKSYTDTDS